MLNKKLIFIQTTFGDAHQMIRFKELKRHYKEFELLAFERSYYDSTEDIDFVSLGNINHGKYFGRLLKYFNAVKIIRRRKSRKLHNDIYFYGFDLLPILSLLINKKNSSLIFEIPDIRELYFKKNIIARILIQLLKISLRRVAIVVVTSELYILKFMQRHHIKINDYVVIENKVHLAPRINRNQLRKSKIKTFGYFGLIRCKRSLEILHKFLEVSVDSKLIIYGYFQGISQDLELKLISHPKVSYLGTYKSPCELDKIYKNIDISWIAYPYSKELDGNYKYARTNRFYEAGYFCIPMIANKDSGDAFYVEKYECGVKIDLGNIEETVRSLLNINFKDLEKWKDNLNLFSEDEFRSTENDYNELLKNLQKLY